MFPIHLLPLRWSALSVAILLVTASSSPAALTYSGMQNISIPTNFDGVYFTFNNVNDASSFTTSFSEPMGTWHFNPFFGGGSVGTSNVFRPVTTSSTTNSPIINLALGTIIDGTDTFPPGFSGSTTHMGAGAGQFQNGVMGILGFAVNFSGFDHYGYARVTLWDDGTAGTVHDWTWDTTAGFAVTAVPEPSQVVALTLGLSLAFAYGHHRRRRSTARGSESVASPTKMGSPL